MKSVSGFSCSVAALAMAAGALTACAKTQNANNEQTAAAEAQTGQGAKADRSATAINLLVAVAQARTSIERHQKDAAENQLHVALSALKTIQGVPLVPIYAELSRTSFLAPVEAAKKEKPSAPASGSPTENAAAEATANSASAAASNASANAVANESAPLAAQAVTASYTRVLLDTSVTKTQLNAAQAALDRGDFNAADNSLKQLQQSVVLESVATRMPLVRARENLALASTDARTNDWSGVKTQLDAAAKSLAAYSQSAPPADLADVQLLQKQIASYASSVDKQHSDAVAKIDGWWGRVAELTDKPA